MSRHAPKSFREFFESLANNPRGDSRKKTEEKNERPPAKQTARADKGKPMDSKPQDKMDRDNEEEGETP